MNKIDSTCAEASNDTKENIQPTMLSVNPNAEFTDRFAQEAKIGIQPSMAALAREDLKQWPVYKQTPLVRLPGFAKLSGVSEVWVKDEGQRMPLMSFKALGGAFALGEDIRDRLKEQLGQRPSYQDLWNKKYARHINKFCAFAATDGNHGRSLAWGASQFGCECVIFIPANVSQKRQEMIEELGATVIRTKGNYEFAVEQAAEHARQHANGFFIQDTSDKHYQLPCQRIMHGYTLLSEEIRLQLDPENLPSHLFLHVGCGGFAAAVAADMWIAYGAKRPKIISVEPLCTDSFRRSIDSGKMEIVEGDHDTLMIGLSVGEVSYISWPILKSCVDYAMSINDETAVEVLNLCADGVENDPPMVVGETGGAGLAALLEAVRHPKIKATLGIDSTSKILTVNTEGAIDRQLYNQLRKKAC